MHEVHFSNSPFKMLAKKGKVSRKKLKANIKTSMK